MSSPALTLFLTDLLKAPAIDDAAFADAVYRVLSEGGIDEQTFRAAFGLSAGAVERWTQRQSLPQPLVRANIIAWMLETLNQPASR